MPLNASEAAIVSPEPAAESTQPEDRLHVDVTVAIARAGYIYQMVQSEELGVYWELRFRTPGGKVVVEVQVQGAWLLFIGEPAVGIPADEFLRALLKMNGRIDTARAGLNDKGEVMVLSHCRRKLLTSELVQQHIESVVDTVLNVQDLAKARGEERPAQL